MRRREASINDVRDRRVRAAHLRPAPGGRARRAAAARLTGARVSCARRGASFRRPPANAGMLVSWSSPAARSTSGRRPRCAMRWRPARAPAAASCSTCVRVTFMDSSGLGLIVAEHAAGARGRRSVRRRGRRDGSDAHRILELSGLANVLELVDDPDASSRRDVTRAAGAGIREVLRAAARSAATRSPSTGTHDPLGPPETWPRSLQTIVRVVLTSRFSMWMAWGPELTFFCNDAYRRDTLGKKYPWALGRSAREVWAEIWPDIGPRIEAVMRTGVATWDEALLLFLERSGYVEETYHTFSYSPLTDDDGASTGMLCVVSEETERVIGERRMATLRDLGSGATTVTEDEVLAAARPPPGRQPARRCRSRIVLPLRRGRRRAARAPPPAAGGHAATRRVAGRRGSRVVDLARGCRPADRRVGRAAVGRRSCSRSPAGPGPALRLPRRRPEPLPPARRRLPRVPRPRRRADRGGARERARLRGRARAAPRRWPSSTARRPRSSPTSATSCARR